MTTPTPPRPADGAPHAQSYRWVVLGVAALAQTAASIVAQGVYTLIPAFQAAFQLSQASSALAIAALNGGQVLSMMMLGRLIDRHGERSVVGGTMVLMGLAALAASRFATSYATLLVFLALMGAAYASVQPGGTRAILRWFAPAQRGLAAGIRQAGLPLGTALAALALPLLAEQRGWQAALVLQGAAGVLGGVVFMLAYRSGETPRQATRVDPAQAAPAAAAAMAPPPSLRQTVAMLMRYSALWPVMLAGVAMVSFQYTFATHVLTFLQARFGMSMVAAAALYSVSQWVAIAARIGLAWASDLLWPNRRARSLAWIMAATAASTLVFIMVPAGTPAWALVGLFMAIGIFGVGWYPLYVLQVAEMAPPTAVAATISFSMTMNMLSITLVPPVFGLIVDAWGYQPAWLALVALVLAAMVRLHRGARSAEAASALR